MASRSGRMSEMQLTTKPFRSETSPHRINQVVSKPSVAVPVVYYLSRNGQLEHPHFMEVPLTSHSALFLRDVICRLNVLRGKGVAALYSWSCKRSYKNGFVWHDLSEDDFIYPAHGHEYVLKGSLLPPQQPPDTQIAIVNSAIPHRRSQRRNQSCSSIESSVEEFCVYKATDSSSGRHAAADASTQTEDIRLRRRRPPPEIVEVEEKSKDPHRDEIETSPPPSDSSPETLEKLMKAEGRLILRPDAATKETSGGKVHRPRASGKSSVLMQLITCGPILFKDCGAGQGLISQYRIRAPRGSGCGGVKSEDKEYFSRSMVETKKEEFPSLKRSSSHNTDR